MRPGGAENHNLFSGDSGSEQVPGVELSVCFCALIAPGQRELNLAYISCRGREFPIFERIARFSTPGDLPGNEGYARFAGEGIHQWNERGISPLSSAEATLLPCNSQNPHSNQLFLAFSTSTLHPAEPPFKFIRGPEYLFEYAGCKEGKRRNLQ